jgi:hypothetical protein
MPQSCRIEPSLFYQNPAGQNRATRSAEASAPLSKPAWAALVTGAYITLVGLAVLIWPVRVFGLLFNAKTIAPGWIRVGGVLAMVRIYHCNSVRLSVTGRFPFCNCRSWNRWCDGNRAGHVLKSRLTSQAIVGCKHDEGGMVLHRRNRAMVRQGTSTIDGVNF